MATCEICGRYSVLSDKHKCPPIFVVQDEDTDSYDPENIYSYWNEEAARMYVEKMDSDYGGEYTDGKHTRIVIVTGPDGKVTKCSVEPEYILQYHIMELKDENSNMDSNLQSSGGSE